MKIISIGEKDYIIKNETYEELKKLQQRDYPDVDKFIKGINKNKSPLYNNDVSDNYELEEIYRTNGLKDVVELFQSQTCNRIELRKEEITFWNNQTDGRRISFTKQQVKAMWDFFNNQQDI